MSGSGPRKRDEATGPLTRVSRNVRCGDVHLTDGRSPHRWNLVSTPRHPPHQCAGRISAGINPDPHTGCITLSEGWVTITHGSLGTPDSPTSLQCDSIYGVTSWYTVPRRPRTRSVRRRGVEVKNETFCPSFGRGRVFQLHFLTYSNYTNSA